MFKKIFKCLPVNAFSFWQKIHPTPHHGFFLGSTARTRNDHIVYMSLAEPQKIITSLKDIQLKIKNKKRSFAIPKFVGSLGFDAGRMFDPGIKKLKSKPDPLSFPVLLFGEYSGVVKLDFLKKTTTIYSEKKSDIKRVACHCEDLKGPQQFIAADSDLGLPRRAGLRPAAPRNDARFEYLGLAQFSDKVKKAKAAIARGDIYQANLSIRFKGTTHKTAVELYQSLCEQNPSPYAALIKQGPQWIVSCSPELLFSIEGNKIATRPIAGTRPRGLTNKHDTIIKGQLLLSPKERAEHIMLVDLERNDIGKVAEAGSVKVKESYSIERYSHVMHIVSEVQGILRKDKDAIDALQALFPGGTITGCPKIKSMEVIQELEGQSRGPFYGSVGYFCANGDAKFNILIRTALMKKNKIYIQAGAGIVADSHPVREYEETKAKAQALLEAAC